MWKTQSNNLFMHLIQIRSTVLLGVRYISWNKKKHLLLFIFVYYKCIKKSKKFLFTTNQLKTDVIVFSSDVYLLTTDVEVSWLFSCIFLESLQMTTKRLEMFFF